METVLEQWCDKDEVERLNVRGNLNASDVEFLKGMKALRHLDIEDATIEDNALADNAFANSGIISIKLPKGVTSFGQGLFNGVDNPNLLLYVTMSAHAPSSVKNAITKGEAYEIALVDSEGNTNFYCSEAFKVQNISYTHDYRMKTQMGKMAGWETIALPFDVQKITHKEKGEIAPFAAGSQTAKPFWLYSLGEGGFVAADRIEANTPYIISMPNDSTYADRYILGGEVTFEASNVTVPATEENVSHKGNVGFVPTTMAVAQSANVYAINKNETIGANLPGSAFVPDYRDVQPFEAYITMNSGANMPRAISIAELSDVASGIAETRKSKLETQDRYNLQGQKVDASYKGVVIECGRKIVRR